MDTTTPTETPPAPASTRRVSLPGGTARVLDEVAVPSAGREGDELVVQAVERGDGTRLLRLGYRRGGHTMRGPVTAAPAEVAALLAAARAAPVLAATLRLAR